MHLPPYGDAQPGGTETIRAAPQEMHPLPRSLATAVPAVPVAQAIVISAEMVEDQRRKPADIVDCTIIEHVTVIPAVQQPQPNRVSTCLSR